MLELILTYILIGFGFAAGFALFRWLQRKLNRGKNNRRDGWI